MLLFCLLCHNATLQLYRLQSVTAIVTKPSAERTSQNAVSAKFVAYLDREATPRLRGTGRASAEDPGTVVAPWARTPRASGPSADRHARLNDPGLLFLCCTPPQVRQNRISACRQRRVVGRVAVNHPDATEATSSRILRFTCKFALFWSGAEGIRTPDLRRAKAALSQLSYGPMRAWMVEFTAVAPGGLTEVGIQGCVFFVGVCPTSGLDRMTMCDMNRVVGAHTSPFPFPITPERRAPASLLTGQLIISPLRFCRDFDTLNVTLTANKTSPASFLVPSGRKRRYNTGGVRPLNREVG